MHPITLLASSIALLIYFLAVWRGGGPERIVGGLLLVVFVADEIYASVAGRIVYDRFETFLFAGDLVQLAIFMWLSVRANRFWPLVAAALKLVSAVAHPAVLLLGGMQRAYWVMVEGPAFLILVTLAIGLSAHLLRQRRIGPYPDWRPQVPAA